jgi:hypothetical protein
VLKTGLADRRSWRQSGCGVVFQKIRMLTETATSCKTCADSLQSCHLQNLTPQCLPTDASLTSVKWLIVTQWMKQEELNARPFCSAGFKIFMKDYNRLHARRRYQEMPYDCGTSVAKYLLCLFNFVFFVSTLSFYATRLQSIPRLHFNIYVQVFQVASFPHAPLLVSLTCHTFCG